MTTPVVTVPDTTRPVVKTMPGSHTQWQVESFWLGKNRPVFTGTLFECLRYAKEMQ